MNHTDNLILIGMPGAGKSTIGVLLAKALGMDFIDTDILIQQRSGRLLQDIIDNGLLLDQLKTDVVEVKLWEQAEDGAYPATKEEAYIEVTSYGGDVTGYQIPFTLHFTGAKVKGNFNVATKAFTAI